MITALLMVHSAVAGGVLVINLFMNDWGHDRKPFWQVALSAAFWEVPLVYGLVAEQVIRWRDARAK